MNVDEMRALLKLACERAGSQVAWAKAHDVGAAYLSDVLNGRREPGGKILRALGLRRLTCYRAADE